MSKDSKTPQKIRPRLLAAASAGAILVLGLGASALLPRPVADTSTVQPQGGQLEQVAARSTPPRMLEAGAPFSFADLVERVSPAVVTVTAIEQESAQDQMSQLDDLPAPFRDLFNQYNQGRPLQPRKAVSMGSGFIIERGGIIV